MLPRRMRALLPLLAVLPGVALAQSPRWTPTDATQATIDGVAPVVLREWIARHATAEVCLSFKSAADDASRDPSATWLEQRSRCLGEPPCTPAVAAPVPERIRGRWSPSPRSSS